GGSLKNRGHLLVFVLLISFAALSGLTVFSQDARTIGKYELIKEVKIGDTVSEYTYRATLSNNATSLRSAIATASSTSPATTIIDGSVSFGPVGPGLSVASSDTFVFRQDRRVAFNWSSIQWTITARDNHSPVANAGPDQTVAAASTITLNGSGSTDSD